MRWHTLALLASGLPAAAHAQTIYYPPQHTAERAGYPPCTSKCATPARDDCTSTGGYVGGACRPKKGEGRDAETEGVWGWDYVGKGWYPGRVFLSWYHCGKNPPPGPYKTDGPHVPDPIAAKRVRKSLIEGGE